jgi:peptidyl-prolyl cis-trans isomerase D
MLRFFSAMSKSWFGPFIMAVAVIALVGLGFTSMRTAFESHGNDVVDAGSHQVTIAQFQRLFQRDQQSYQQQTGQPYPLEEAVAQGADQQMLQQLAAETSYLEMLSRAGIRPTPEMIASALKQQAESGAHPELAGIFDPVTGHYSQQGLTNFLREIQLPQQEFFDDVRDGLADQSFSSAVDQGFEPPRIYTAIEAALLMEGRDISYFVIPTSSVPVPPKPTDAQLNALIDQFKDKLMLPERRKLTIVRFSAKAIAPTIAIDPAAV